MTPRALAAACHGAAAVWLAGFLAWSAANPPAQGEAAPERVARIAPVREEVPAIPERSVAEAAPEPEAIPPHPEPPDERVDPAVTSVGRSERARGARLLDEEGAFPVLTCSYEDFESFDAYAEAMQRLGARFVVVRRREIVASFDPASGALREGGVHADFSPRARDYTGEPGLAVLARTARERYGDGAVVMMLVPRAFDAALFGGIAGALAGRGDGHADYREIQARYVRTEGGGVRLRVDAGVRAGGEEVPLDLLFDLSEIARAEPSA